VPSFSRPVYWSYVTDRSLYARWVARSAMKQKRAAAIACAYEQEMTWQLSLPISTIP
jgi:hypothetical protein